MGHISPSLPEHPTIPLPDRAASERPAPSSRTIGARPAPSGGLLATIEIGRRSIEMATRVARYLAQGQPAANIEPVSFRRIAQLGLLPWGASSMWRAARIYQLAQQYPELYGYKHLRVAHISPIICLRGPMRIAVLRRAERRRWSRRRVEARVKAILASQKTLEETSGPHSLREYLGELTPVERQAALLLLEGQRLPTRFAACRAESNRPKPRQNSTFSANSQQSSFS